MTALLLLVVGNAAAFGWVLYRGNTIPISVETTHLTSPVDADGYVDYSAELTPGIGPPPEENAASIYYRMAAAELRAEHGEVFHRRACRQLGIPPEIDAVDKLDGWVRFWKSKVAERTDLSAEAREEFDQEVWKRFEACGTRVWTGDEFPLVAEYVDANHRAVELALEASARPVYAFYPPRSDRYPDASFLSPLLVARRNTAEVVRFAALRHAGEGRGERAFQLVDALHRMARHGNAAKSPFECQLAAMFLQIGIVAERQLLPLLTTRDAVRRRRTLVRNLPPVADWVATFEERERFASLNGYQAFDMIRRGGAIAHRGEAILGYKAGTQTSVANRLRIATHDLAFVCRTVNQWHDRIVQILWTPAVDRREAVRECDRWLETTYDSLSALRPDDLRKRRAFDAHIRPHLSAAATVAWELTRLEWQRLLLDIDFAVREFEVVHGRLPVRREDLVPEHLENWPADPYDGQPLRDVTIDGRWIVYSVFKDGADRSSEWSIEPWSDVWASEMYDNITFESLQSDDYAWPVGGEKVDIGADSGS